jgi:cyclopropane fatty-acyl-phospholipid synthase-like methyltransferase
VSLWKAASYAISTRLSFLTIRGFTVFGVDASRTLIEAFRKRFPSAFVERAGVEDSDFFQRTFDGVVACGLMFLMPEDTQSLLIHKVASALNPNGRFLFTSPKEIVKWRDALTDRESFLWEPSGTTKSWMRKASL